MLIRGYSCYKEEQKQQKTLGSAVGSMSLFQAIRSSSVYASITAPDRMSQNSLWLAALPSKNMK